MKKDHVVLFLVAFLVVLVDQVSKYCIRSALTLHESIPVIDGFFNITYVRNPGAAFGFLAGTSPALRSVFLIAVTLIVIVLIVIMIGRNQSPDGLFTSSLSLVLGGAVGNLIDRIYFGEVTDFLDVYMGAAHWPAFNAADSAITVGAVILILGMIRRKKSEN